MRCLVLWLLSLPMLWVPLLGTSAVFDDREKLQQRLIALTRDLATLNRRVRSLEERSGTARFEFANQSQQMVDGLSALRGQVELLTFQLEEVKKRQRDFYVDLDTRLRRLESQRSSSGNLGSSATSGGGAKSQSSGGFFEGDIALFNRAVGLFKVSEYQKAEDVFVEFLSTYPRSQLLPDARYWLANARFARGNYPSAIEAYQSMIVEWPQHPRASEAMLNMGSSQSALGQLTEAQSTWELLISRFPRSAAAGAARQRLRDVVQLLAAEAARMDAELNAQNLEEEEVSISELELGKQGALSISQEAEVQIQEIP